MTGRALPHHLNAEQAACFEGRGPLRILNVGCGSNQTATYFRALGHSHIGLDIDHPAADVFGAIECLPFPNRSFDAVLAVSVLQYVLDLRTAIAEIHSVLVPGGTVTGTAAFLEPWVWESLVHLSPAGVERLLQQGGFRIERIWPGWSVEDAIEASARLTGGRSRIRCAAAGRRSTMDRLTYAGSIHFHAVRPL